MKYNAQQQNRMLLSVTIVVATAGALMASGSPARAQTETVLHTDGFDDSAAYCITGKFVP